MKLVKLSRRALFWVWPQLDAFCAASIEMARHQLIELDAIATVLTDLQAPTDTRIGDSSQPSNGMQRCPADELATSVAALLEPKMAALVWIDSVKLRATLQDLSERVRVLEDRDGIASVQR
jgi:hypothetical protein